MFKNSIFKKKKKNPGVFLYCPVLGGSAAKGYLFQALDTAISRKVVG